MSTPLPYLVDVASSHGGPKSVAKVAALVRAQAPVLDESALTVVGLALIGWLHTGALPLHMQFAWQDALDAVRGALGYEDIAA